MRSGVLFRWVLAVPLLFGVLGPGPAWAQSAPPAEPDAKLARIESDSFVPVAFEGFVLEPDGAPAERAVVADRLGSPPGEVVTFSVTAEDEHDLSPSVVCVPPSGSSFPRGMTLVTCTATDASGNQSSCQFSVTVHLKVRKR